MFRRKDQDEQAALPASEVAETQPSSFDPFADTGTDAAAETEQPSSRPFMLEVWLDTENAEAIPYSEITRISRHRDWLITLHCLSYLIEIEGCKLGALWDDLLAHRAELIQPTQGSPTISQIKLIPLTEGQHRSTNIE